MSRVPEANAAQHHPDPGFASEVRAGLDLRGQKTLPCKYLYDALGSALFEAITQLPEYGLWRAERTLLQQHAGHIAELAGATRVIELGSGSASKTAPLLKAMLHRQAVSYCSVDVSATALAMTRRELGALPGLSMRTIEDDYLPGLESAMATRGAHERTLVLFLGSSLGNFDALSGQLFLQRVRRLLQPGDALLLGADLEKPAAQLIAAYDDALGVTAAFNLNLLARMNRDLGADFVLPQFRHRARYNAGMCNVEMHIESLRNQRVKFPRDGFTVSFEAGETIHTESSHKYSLEELDGLAAGSGFASAARWVEPEARFCSGLFVSV